MLLKPDNAEVWNVLTDRGAVRWEPREKREANSHPPHGGHARVGFGAQFNLPLQSA